MSPGNGILLYDKEEEIKTWVIYGLVASLTYGLSAVPLKYAMSKKFLSAPFSVVVIGTIIGMALVLIPYIVLKGEMGIRHLVDNQAGLFWGIVSGIIGVIGSIYILLALNDPLTEVSKLMAIVSTSVLFTAFFSAVFLGELPAISDKVTTFFGVGLLIAGIRLIVK